MVRPATIIGLLAILLTACTSTTATAPALSLPVPLHGVPTVGLDGRLFVLGGSDRAGAIENRGRALTYRP